MEVLRFVLILFIALPFALHFHGARSQSGKRVCTIELHGTFCRRE